MAKQADGDYYYVEDGNLNDLFEDFQLYENGGNLTFYDVSNNEEAQYVAGAGFDVPASRGYHVNGTQVVGPQAQSYTTANVTSDTALDADADAVDGVADVLGTLIQDLQSHGLIG